MFRIARQTVRDFIEDDCPTMAAALAYYTVFSLAPLLLIVISLAGLIFGPQQVQAAITQQVQSAIGQEGAKQVATMISGAGRQSSTGWLGAIFGFAALILGATTAFVQLQAALNRAWEVKPDPAASGAKSFLGKRLLSFGMVLTLAFLLLVSLILSAAVSMAGHWLQQFLPSWISSWMLEGANSLLSLAVIAVLFAAIFRYLPDARVEWRDVRAGAILTAVLFVIGKFALGYYLGKSSAASGYGAAGSLVLILLWTYYSSMILLLGAEFTQSWAQAKGRSIEPEAGAVRVVEEVRRPAA